MYKNQISQITWGNNCSHQNHYKTGQKGKENFFQNKDKQLHLSDGGKLNHNAGQPSTTNSGGNPSKSRNI